MVVAEDLKNSIVNGMNGIVIPPLEQCAACKHSFLVHLSPIHMNPHRSIHQVSPLNISSYNGCPQVEWALNMPALQAIDPER